MTKGVLGVAIIQSILAAIGLVAMGVPAAGIWAGAVLMLAIMQLPPILILAPIAIWVFSVAEPVPATIFAVYSFVVSISDSFLKPMFLGRGVDVPMLVILIGAIGGADLRSGIIGLFIGAVVLALGYQLLIAWMGHLTKNLMLQLKNLKRQFPADLPGDTCSTYVEVSGQIFQTYAYCCPPVC